MIFFVLSVLISVIFPTGFSIRYSYQLDDIAREPIIAPFDFGILKTEQKLNSDLKEAKKSISYSFKRDQETVDNQLATLDTFFIYLNDIQTSYYQYVTSKDSLYKYRYEPEFETFQDNFIADSTTYSALYNEFLNRYAYQVDQGQWNQLLGISEELIDEPTNLDSFKTNISGGNNGSLPVDSPRSGGENYNTIVRLGLADFTARNVDVNGSPTPGTPMVSVFTDGFFKGAIIRWISETALDGTNPNVSVLSKLL